MSTPLYKRLKDKGTSFYAFPSSASDLNLANYNDFYDLNFTKFTLLNIPRQVDGSPTSKDGVLDFLPKRNNGDNAFYSDDPNYNSPSKLSEQLVESLRNYVANYDTSLHESRINTNTDFYNIAERFTPTEPIFWKWARKMNLIDFEPAVHKVDWDKNLSDFDNQNASTITNVEYFRKYLWKEREVIYYKTTEILQSSSNTPYFSINEIAKFKSGDKVILTGDVSDGLVLSGFSIYFNYSYTVTDVVIGSGVTYVYIDSTYTGSNIPLLGGTYIHLDYNRLIEYIGEINQITNVQTASRVGQEVTAYIPHQGGRTPTVLFGTRSNTNYYPNLEIPILADEIQTEIVGAETLNSPIRSNPQNYPGSFFGQFDTQDNTYLCTNGDSVRYQGDYFGVKLTDNAGLSADDYVEKLTDFNSDDIDGVFLDVNRNHYYKMNIPNLECKNFDEFSSLSIQGQAPADFDFNAILWYYELTERDQNNNINSYVNLYGIEFLNNPENDDDNFATLITPYHKLVTNGVHDGLSYMFNLNLSYNIDNDVQPLTYDPSTIYNMFSFDMYNEMMRRLYQVNENFVNIIQEFIRINMDIQEMKSLLYSQTDLDELKSRMNNMENLLKLYATNQFTDSDTAKISVDYSGIYPKLKMNVTGVEYDEIQNVSLTDAYNYNSANNGSSYPISLSYTSKMLLNLINDNISTNGDTVVIMLDRDLKNNQKLDIIIKPQYGLFSQTLYLNMMFINGYTSQEIAILPSGNITTPTDVSFYNSFLPESSTFNTSHYMNENIYVNCISVFTGLTLCPTGYIDIVITEDLFATDDMVFVQNLYFLDASGNTLDLSDGYKILSKSGTTLTINLPQKNACGFKLVGQPRVSYYRGIQVSILRVNASNTSSFADRYNITYKII